jgi:hypothetical protein
MCTIYAFKCNLCMHFNSKRNLIQNMCYEITAGANLSMQKFITLEGCFDTLLLHSPV